MNENEGKMNQNEGKMKSWLNLNFRAKKTPEEITNMIEVIFGAKIQIISVFPHFSPFYPQFDSFHPQSFFGGYISNLVEVEARILFSFD